MSPLELSREVNDSLQNSDFAAALAPLKAQPDLRVSEFPILEEKSLTSLTKALQNPQNARFWAHELLTTTDVAHIFVYRTLLRLGEAAQPIGAPLRQMVLDIWREDTPPTAEIDNADTQKQRSNQERALIHALEFALSFDTELALELCVSQVKIFLPIELAFKDLYQAPLKQTEAARKALQTALGDAITALHRGQQLSLFQLANGMANEVYIEAHNSPEARQLFEPQRESDVEWNRKHWNPLQTFRSAMGCLIGSKKETQQLALKQVRTFLSHHICAGLQENGDTSVTHTSAAVALALLNPVARFENSSPTLEQLENSRSFIVSLPADNISRRLWVALSHRFFYGVFGYSHRLQTHISAEDAQKAIDMLDVLQLEPNESSEFNKRLEEARREYHPFLAEQQAVRLAFHRPKPVVPIKTSEIKKALALLTRLPEEGASEFFKRVHEARLALHKEYEAKRLNAPDDNFMPFYRFIQKWEKRFQQTIASFGDDDKRTILLEICYSEGIMFYHLGDWWKDKALLQPLLPALELAWDDALYLQAVEVRKGSPSSTAEERNWAHFRTGYVWMFVGEAGGIKHQLALVQRAFKSKAKQLVPEWETHLLAQLSPIPQSYQAWLEWKLDESYDEMLDYLALRIPKQPAYNLENAYSQIAIAFYRRYTRETRPRCYEFASMAKVPSRALFEVLYVHRDDWSWLRILEGAQQKDPAYFEIWQFARSEEEYLEHVTTAVFEALAGAASESGALMMMEMLKDVAPEEFLAHAPTIARSVESTNPKVAKWALEKLLTMPAAELDWPHLIEMTAEKSWSDNMGLAKIAIRMLGTAPAEYATNAWEKLEEALSLENLVIVESCARALSQLKRRNSNLSLASPAMERLEELSQLAPERFAKYLAKLRAV